MKPLRRYASVAIAIWMSLPGLCSAAEDSRREQDRRIEERTRAQLAPSLPPEPAGHPEPVAPSDAPPVHPPLADLFFVSVLPKNVVYHYDAAKAVALLRGVDDERLDLTSQIAYLDEEQLLPPRLRGRFKPDAPLRRGAFAYLLYRATGLRGGLALTLFGPTERWAMKELAFRGWISPGLASDLISGEEFVAAVARAAEEQARHIRPER